MGLACLMSGVDYIGIEREPEYLEIADARVRYWEGVTGIAAYRNDKIESDHRPPPPEPEPEISVDDWVDQQ